METDYRDWACRVYMIAGILNNTKLIDKFAIVMLKMNISDADNEMLDWIKENHVYIRKLEECIGGLIECVEEELDIKEKTKSD